MMSRFFRLVLIAAAAALALLPRSTIIHASPSTMLPNGWHITPAGAITPLGTLPLHMVEDPTGRWIAVTTGGYGALAVSLLDEQSGTISASLPIASAFYGLAFAGQTLYVSTANGDGIARYKVSPQGSLTDVGVLSVGAGNLWVAGLAISNSRMIYAAAAAADTIIALDADRGVNLWALRVGSWPYDVALSRDEKTIYVSNWVSATVSVVDAKSGALIKNIAVGAHPNSELVSPDGKTLYVACANDDSVAVIDTSTNSVRETIDAGIYPHALPGAMPNGLSLSADGKTLFVADAGDNAIVAVDVTATPASVFGAVATGWYPTDVVASRDGGKLFVLDGKGISGHANPDFEHADIRPPNAPENRSKFVGALATGDLETLPLPDHAGLVAGLNAVRLNASYNPIRPAANQFPKNLHVIYVIKENRTYDEVLGDDPRGNGDSHLAIFGQRITPNVHNLARSFVLLDNFETDSAVTADGHNWSTAAYASDYVEKLWPPSYSGRRREYDFEQDGAAAPPGGYLWDAAHRAGVSVRDYGEFVNFRGGAPYLPTVASLQGLVDPKYPGFDLTYSDQDRMSEWLREFRRYVINGDLPRLEIIRLPNDHTAATKPGAKTPYAMIADNDYALGRLVDAVSHSQFWRDTIIFSVEDDAQAGPDHVSDRRTEALVIGARVKRGFVDHTHYSTSSMLRTIELVLGMAPMSQFDGGATPMLADFSSKPDVRPWSASKPLVDMTSVNPGNPDGRTSQALNLDDADAADPATLNAILWRYAMTHKPM